jgi:hypothetical protein
MSLHYLVSGHEHGLGHELRGQRDLEEHLSTVLHQPGFVPYELQEQHNLQEVGTHNHVTKLSLKEQRRRPERGKGVNGSQ